MALGRLPADPAEGVGGIASVGISKTQRKGLEHFSVLIESEPKL
jgi:hypothetical protein